jgi:hypothetical protein
MRRLHRKLDGHVLATDAGDQGGAGRQVTRLEGLAEGGDASGKAASPGVLASEADDVASGKGNGCCELDGRHRLHPFLVECGSGLHHHK